jgi:dihydropyrimidinase
MTLLLQDGNIVTADGSRRGSLRIDGSRIREVGALVPQPGDTVIDCAGCLILPGGIETHSHLDLECGPGLVTADGFASGSRAALAGGTTTVLDFATQFGGQTLAEGLRRWQAKADGVCVTDYGFHLAMTQWRPEFAAEMAEAVAAGVTSFKLYLAYRGSMMVDDDQILAALRAAQRLGVTIGFHCENGYLVSALVGEALAAGQTGAYYHPRTRPAELEREAVGRLGVIARLADAEHYIVHLSSGESLPEIRAARARGSRMTVETCPQYLVLDEGLYGPPDGDGTGDGTAARTYIMSPPLRPAEHQEGLWRGLASGEIQFVGTDHCSFTVRQKAEAADFSTVPNGVPGIELRLAVLYTYGVAAGRLSPERFVAVTSENAARYFGLFPRKGALRPGSDADLVVYDPAPSWTVSHPLLHDAAGYTPYEGMTMRGRVRDVFLRGRQAVRDGHLAGDLPPGRYLRRDRPDGGVR